MARHEFKNIGEVKRALEQSVADGSKDTTILVDAMLKTAAEIEHCQKRMNDCEGRMNDCQQRMNDCQKKMDECQKKMG